MRRTENSILGRIRKKSNFDVDGMRGALLESGFHRTSRMIFVRVDVGLDEQFDDCSIEP